MHHTYHADAGKANNGDVITFASETNNDAFMKEIGSIFPRLSDKPVKFALYNGKTRNLEYLPDHLTTPFLIKQSRLLNRSALYIVPKEVCELLLNIYVLCSDAYVLCTLYFHGT